MTHVITSACVDNKDASCATVCPVDCIYEVDRMMVIAPDECIDCGACMDACPVDAPKYEVNLGDDDRVWLQINALWPDRGAIDRDVSQAMS